MRPLVLLGPLPPPSGGVASYLADLAATVRSCGGSVRLVNPAAKAGLAVSLLRARWGGDLVHLHTNGHNPGSWRLIRLIGLLARRPLLTLHSGLAPAYIARHLVSTSVSLAPYADVICVNRAIAEQLLRAGIASSRLHLAPAFSYSLPLPLSPAGLSEIRRHHPYLLAATLSHGCEYGADVLRDGFARLAQSLDGVALVLFGPASREAALVEGFSRAGVRGRVYYFGDLPRAEVLGLLAQVDLFIRPTRADGDALSVREALALGCRVVASDAVARPQGTALFRSGDSASLAREAGRALARPPDLPAHEDHLAPVLHLYRQRSVLPSGIGRGDPGGDSLTINGGDGAAAANGSY